ncbi:hypothetical protein [Pedobacter antarcticus]|uniref:NACHT domain-containing protein n=1 Tax=Pedobacter antarcticus TaxID=34086 RepID=UPI00292F3501|nr:hypothetical protein [Pedobacter antarcticus]
MKINRHDLLEELYDFALNNGGMVIGKPGIGKSYLLQQLQNKLVDNDFLCLTVKIDNAADSSDEAIEAELQLDENWITTLKDVELINEHKAVLIFDAFDAARDENKRKGFLKQIKKAKVALADKWNIIVSVRTYDASKSKDLERIFANSSGEISFNKKKYIHELTDDEVKQAFTDNNIFNQLYDESSAELKEILHVPFFLKILEDIIIKSTLAELEIVKNFRSEIQLLEAYWQIKVIDTEKHLIKERFLLNFTNNLIESKSLSFPKSELLKSINDSDVEVFDYLRSENILDEISHNNSRISFSHNILFDYAVGRYCLSEDYPTLLDFITKDTSRPFFFRPSFIYFFTTMWYGNKDAFWKIYNNLAISEQKEIKLFVRLIVNGTIAYEFNDLHELQPILSKNGTDAGNEQIGNLLQSIRFIRTRATLRDIQLLKALSGNLSLRYLFEFAFLLERAIVEPPREADPNCGIAARNLLDFILVNRTTEYKQFVDRIGATRGVELVARTYGTDITESEKILRRVFNIIDEPGFDIYYFTYLAEHIKYILKFDPKFVSDVYYLIFDHTETSDEKTSMGAGVVMSLISNRRQDFEMCYYRLQKFFSEFLSAAPLIATATGIDIVNKHLIIKKVRIDNDEIVHFDYKGIKSMILPDYSSIWAENRFGNKQEAIAQNIIDYIEQLLLKDQLDKAREMILVYVSKSQVGYLWKLLFRLAAKYPKQLFDDIYPLILIPQLVSANETIYEVNEFIQNSADLLKDVQIGEIEDAVFESFSEERHRSIQLLLSMLPKDRLQRDRSKAFMETREIISNEPRYKSSSSVSAYSNDEWLADHGVDLSDEKNKQLTVNINKLDAFNHTFLNETPYHEEHKDFLELAERTFSLIENEKDLPKDLFYSTLNAVTKTATAFSKGLNNIPRKNFKTIKKIIFFAFRYESPYDNDQIANSPAHGYSPTPRIESASALIPIYEHEPDEEILGLIRDAATHINGIIRFNVIRELPLLFNKAYDLYQDILFERLTNEEDSFVYASLLSAIYFKKNRVVEDGKRVIELINEKKGLLSSRNEFVEAYADLLLWFISNHDIPEALVTLKNAYKYPEFCRTVIFKLFKTIQTYIPRSEFVSEFKDYTTKIEVVKHYIAKAKEELQVEGDNVNLELPGNKNAIELFDEVILRIYFVLEPKQRISNSLDLDADDENRKDLYFLVKSVFEDIIDVSGGITKTGLIIGHTAHYFIQCLNSSLYYDPKDILRMVADITKYSIQAGYTFDSFAIKEIVKLTEQLLADHRDLLLQDDCFKDLLSVLDIYINSGWVDALELLWKLDEIFK